MSAMIALSALQQPKYRLVAPRLPVGKVLFETAGCSMDAGELGAFARRCGGCPEEIEVVSGSDVLLEWHDVVTGSIHVFWRHQVYVVLIAAEEGGAA